MTLLNKLEQIKLEQLNRFLLDFPIDNQFGWYGLNEIKIIDNIDKELNN